MSDDNAAKAAHKACVDYNARKETEEIKRLRAENEMLREALLFYVDENNWKMNSPLDMNSGNFTGGPASAAIEGVTEPQQSGGGK